MTRTTIPALTSTTLILIALAMTSQAAAQSAGVAEDAWLQASERSYTTYTELAMRANFSTTSRTPVGELFPGYSEFGLTYGAWLAPLIAVEGQLHVGGGTGDGLFDYSRVSRDAVGARGGVRVAFPTYITPMVAAHIDYTHLTNRWFASEDGTLFGTEGDNPALGVSGVDRHRILGLNTELGVKFNTGRFTSGLVYHALFNMGHQSSRSGVADNRSSSSTFDPTEDRPLPKLGFLQNDNQGIELRFGLRF